jgi:diguanylate cyclase (GGDEF)-like protein
MCILAFAALIVLPAYDAYRQAARDTVNIQRFRLVLNAADLISAERAPTNIMMSLSPADENIVARQNLAQARWATDHALTQVLALGNRDTATDNSDQLKGVASETINRLAAARNEVDRISAQPLKARTLPDVQASISGMIDVADLFHRDLVGEVEISSAENPQLAAYKSLCYMLSDMRDYGGRIASQVMAPIITRMPMPVLNRIESSRSRGRVLELQQLVYAQGDIIGHESGFNELLSIKQQDYFEKNLSLLDAVVDDGQATGRYAISTQVFTERYATALKPIVRLRATFVDEIVNHILAERDAAFNRLIWVGVATLAALLILASLVQMIRMKILHPLLVARETITGLAESGGSLPLPTTGPIREMRHIFEALYILRNRLREREEWTATLKREAERDPLTGLWNRRSLDRFVQAAEADDDENDICLILVDIDHFKQINDTHGHLVGDEVLRQCAGLLKSLVRSSDVVSRFGGEEFAILLRNEELTAAVHVAHSLQVEIASLHIQIPDSLVIVRISASFGVAFGSLAPGAWDKLVGNADAALYRAKAEGRNRVCVA